MYKRQVELYLKNENYTVFKCYTAEEALRVIEEEALDLAILDIMLPGTSGFAPVSYTHLLSGPISR